MFYLSIYLPCKTPQDFAFFCYPGPFLDYESTAPLLILFQMFCTDTSEPFFLLHRGAFYINFLITESKSKYIFDALEFTWHNLFRRDIWHVCQLHVLLS